MSRLCVVACCERLDLVHFNQYLLTPLMIRILRVARCYGIATILGICFTARAETGTTSPVMPKENETIVLSPFEVTTKGDRGYSASQSIGATRVAMPTLDISSSIVTLNEQLFLDRAAVSSMDMITLVSGVQRDSDGQPGVELYSLRGYAVGGISLRDGLPDPLNAADVPISGDASSFARIEVIKGPAGVLYGSHSMGGVINRVSKWPQFKQSTTVELQAATTDRIFRSTVDSTGPLNGDLAYRVILSGRKGTRWWDRGGANDFYEQTASLLRLINKGQGKIWFRGDHFNYKLQREDQPQFLTGLLDSNNSKAIPVVKTGNFAVPREANPPPGDNISLGETLALELGTESSFSGMLNGDWTLRIVGRYSDREGDKSPSYAAGRPVPVDSNGAIVKYTNSAGALVNGDNRFVSADDPRVADWRSTLVLRDFRGYNKSSSTTADLTGKFQSGALNHTAIFSMGYGTNESSRSFFFWNAPNPANTTAVANSFSMLRPVPESVTAQSIVASGAVKQYNGFQGRVYSSSFNFAAMDNISLFNDRLIASAGWRFDDARATRDKYSSALSLMANEPVVDPAATTTTRNTAWTSRYGLVGKPVKNVAIFAQISQTFNPISGTNALTGEPLPNQEGENKEIGIKMDMLGGRFSGTLSYFDMALTNVLVSRILDISQGGGTVQVPVGVQKTKGWEFDLAAEPLPGLNVMAGISSLDSRSATGSEFRGVPVKPNYSLMARYAFPENSGIYGLFFGAAWKHRGQSPGDSGVTFYVASSDEFDVFAGYRFGRWTFQCNVENVLDSEYLWSAVSDTSALRLAPREFRLTIRYTF